MSTTVLPSNATPLERAIEQAADIDSFIGPAVDDVHGLKYQRPLNETVGPWLVLEYGLGPVADFFGTVEDLIDEGRAWQRIRGTPLALERALGWIGYEDLGIEDQARNRRRWHLYQIGMGELPGENEDKRLADAEYLASLSDPARAEMFRGFHGYDVRALAWGNGRYGQTLWGDSSGVRINGGNVKWSHGRHHDVFAIGVISDWAPYGWDNTLEEMSDEFGLWSPNLIWTTPGLYWSGADSEAGVKTWLMLQRTAHLVFFDVDEAPIGFARVIRAPIANNEAAQAISAIYEVRLPFGAGFGSEARSVAVVHDLQVCPDVPAFKSWLRPKEVIAGSGNTVGVTNFVHRFQKTVRETVRLTLIVNPAEVVPMFFSNPAFRLG